jgi:hypothetical protein
MQMTFTGNTRAAFAAAAISLFAIGTANAGSIYTPALFKGGADQLVCIATNTTAATIHVTVKIIGVIGNATETCDLDPNDGGGCQAFRNNDAGYCRITVSSLTNAQVAASVRGVLFTRKTMAPFNIEAVVQAQ